MSFPSKLKTISFFIFLFSYLVPSTSCFAKFNGLFAGAHLGFSLLNGTHKYTNASPQEGKITLNEPGYLAGLQAGYLYYAEASKIIVGAEFYFSMTGINSKKDLKVDGGPVEGQVTIQHRHSLGLAILSGIVINPKVALYGKIALETNKFNLNYENLTFQTPTSEKYGASLRGFVPGMGIFYKWTPKILIGAEYGYSFMKKKQPRLDTVVINGAKRGYSFSANEHRLAAKINYVF